MAGNKQTTFGRDTVPVAAGAVQQFLETNHAEDRRLRAPPMTTKQVKRAYLDRTRGPKISKEERRRRELADLARIKQEEQEAKKHREKERAAVKARMARDKKKEKEQKDKEDKRKQGLPLVAVHPSQDMITRFFRGNGTAKKRESDGTSILPAVIEPGDAVQDEAEARKSADLSAHEDGSICAHRGPSNSPNLQASGERTGDIEAPTDEEALPIEAQYAGRDSSESRHNHDKSITETEDLICQAHVDIVIPVKPERLPEGGEVDGPIPSEAAVPSFPNVNYEVYGNDPEGKPTELARRPSRSLLSGSPPASLSEHRTAATLAIINEPPPKSATSPESSAVSPAAKSNPVAVTTAKPPDLLALTGGAPLKERLRMSMSGHPPSQPIVRSCSNAYASSAPLISRGHSERGLASTTPTPPFLRRGNLSNNRTSRSLSIRAVHNASRPSTMPPPPALPNTRALREPQGEGMAVNVPGFMFGPRDPMLSQRGMSSTASCKQTHQLVDQEDDTPPTSTQLFLMTNLDDFFPSASQLNQELQDQELHLHESIFHSPETAVVSLPTTLISSQDLVISTQDLRDMDWDVSLEGNIPQLEQDQTESEKESTDMDMSIAQDLELFGSQLVADSDSDLGENRHVGAVEHMQRQDHFSGNGGIEGKFASSLEQALELMAQYISDDDWEEGSSGGQPMHGVRHDQEQVI